MRRGLRGDTKRRLRAAQSWAKATFCRWAFIVRFLLLVLAGGVMALHAMAKTPPESDVFGTMMCAVVTPGAAGTAFLILLTVLVARVFGRPCAPLLTVVWDTVVLVLWTGLLAARVVWLVLQWKAAEEGTSARAKKNEEQRDIPTRDMIEMSVEILEEGLLMLLLVGAVVGHSAQAWITVGEMLRARRQLHTQALEKQRARMRLEQRVALRRLRELHEPPPHVHLSQLPAAPRTLMRLSEGRLTGYSSLSVGDSLWRLGPGARESASYMSALSQLRDSEERLLHKVEFQEHDAPEGMRWRNTQSEESSSLQLADGQLRSDIAPSQTSRADVHLGPSPRGTPLPQGSEVRFAEWPQHSQLSQHDTHVYFKQSTQDTASPQDDQRQQRQQHTIPQIVMETSREDMLQLLTPESASQLPHLEKPPVKEPPHQPSKRKRTACGKCIHPAESEAFVPPMLRTSRNAMDVSKGLTPPPVMVPLDQPPSIPRSQSKQTSKPEGGQFVHEQPVRGVCLCPKLMGAPGHREPGTENEHFRDLADHKQSSQDPHQQQQIENTALSGPSLSSRITPTSKGRPTVEVTVAPEKIEANDNLQDQYLNNSQQPDQENTDSQDQEINVASPNDVQISTTPSSNGNPTAPCVCQEVLNKRKRQ